MTGSTIRELVFVQAVAIPNGANGELERAFLRAHGWQVFIQADGSLLIGHQSRTSFAPFRVCGVGYSYRTDDDVAAKAKAKAA